MASLNHCSFIGNLGRDPEMRYTAAGDAVCNFSIACGETWKDAAGEKQEKTEWVSLVAFKRLAEICSEYLKKGSQVYVAGRMQTRKWTDKEGNDRYSTEIVVDKMVMLGGRGEHAAEPSPNEGAKPAAKAVATKNPTAGDLDDDIPF